MGAASGRADPPPKWAYGLAVVVALIALVGVAWALGGGPPPIRSQDDAASDTPRDDGADANDRTSDGPWTPTVAPDAEANESPDPFGTTPPPAGGNVTYPWEPAFPPPPAVPNPSPPIAQNGSDVNGTVA